MENVLTAGMLDSAPEKEKDYFISMWLSGCTLTHFVAMATILTKQTNKKIILAFNGFNKCNGNKHY